MCPYIDVICILPAILIMAKITRLEERYDIETVSKYMYTTINHAFFFSVKVSCGILSFTDSGVCRNLETIECDCVKLRRAALVLDRECRGLGI